MSKEIGTLVVVVLKARNLPDKHSFYKQDVFAQIALQGTTKKTAVEVKGGQHPVWDEELRFPVYEGKGKEVTMMEVSCWSKESRSDDLVGKGELDIAETLRTGEFDDWIPLGINGVMRGDLYLEMTFFAAGPPPALSRRPSKLKPADRLSRPTSGSPPSSHHGSPSPAFAGRPASVADPHLKPQAHVVPRLSPHRPEAALPSLPEEAPSSPPPPEALPAILRPGGGKPHSQHRQSSSVSSIGSISRENGAASPAHAPDVHPHPPPQTHRDSLPLPAFLRPGGGLSPRPSPTPVAQPHSYVPENQIPNLPPAAVGSIPSVTPTPAPVPAPSQQPQRYSSLPHEPPYYGATPVPADNGAPGPADGVIHPHTPQPSAYYPQSQEPTYFSHTPIPAPAPANGAPYSHTPQPSIHHSPPHELVYGPTQIPALPSQTQPNSSYVPPHNWQAQPPSNYPQLQPSTYTAGIGHPSFSFPAPSVTPFTPNNGGYYPPHNQAPGPRPYPYNYPPPPRDPDLDQPTLNNPRYAKPLPLPEEPEGTSTPTPGHVHHHTSSRPQPAKQSSHYKTKSQDTHQSAAERDRQAALQRQKEEEERRRIAKEQEERDLELARKLDIELNLLEEEEANAQAANGSAVGDASQANNNAMPGSWYRHRPGS